MFQEVGILVGLVVEGLEKAYGRPLPEESAAAEERARLIEELKTLRPTAEEQAAAEEAQGDSRRRRALEELEETVRRRARGSGL